MSAEEHTQWMKEFASPYFYPLLNPFACKAIHNSRYACLHDKTGKKCDMLIADLNTFKGKIGKKWIMKYDSYHFPDLRKFGYESEYMKKSRMDVALKKYESGRLNKIPINELL